MISPYLDTGIENMEPLTKEISTPGEPTIISSLGSVNRRFFENIFDRISDREIRYDDEVLISSIKRFKELFALIEEFTGLEYLRREVTSLNRIYTFRNPAEIYEFLSDNVYLIPQVVEAHKKIKEYFPSSDLVLEVVTDPEAPDEKELVIFIHTNLTPDEALDRLEMFDRNWWLDASLDTEGKLCIHVEYR